mgnify:CR=1 FL=1
MALRAFGASNWAAGGALKAAIEAGWVEAPKTETGEFEGEKRFFFDGKDVDEMDPGLVRHLGNEIDKKYQSAVSYDAKN